MSNRFLLSLVLSLALASCKKDKPATTPDNPTPGGNQPTQVACWVTSADKTKLFQRQNEAIRFDNKTNNYPVVEVDSAQRFQPMDGFGATLTGGSAYLINQKLDASARSALLRELFTRDSAFIGLSCLRLSIGASDLSAAAFTYCDSPTPDPSLTHFSIDPEKTDLIPVVKSILALQPGLKLIATPWSAPAWMKTNKQWIGGSLKPEYYPAYAQYFVRYLKAMEAEGIHIYAITPQNEPENPNNNPSMTMSAAEQATFVKAHLGPALKNAGLDVKIILYDHNCDDTAYPLSILADPAAAAFADGSAFHLYGGNIEVLSQVHDAHPEKNVYFTEQYISSKGTFGGDLGWHTRNLIIGAPRNWARTVLEWNLAADANQGPHTPGGCTECLGAVTIDQNTVRRNTAYYILAHASKFVLPGSVRIASSSPNNLPAVAFQRPDGKKVLIAWNDSEQPTYLNLRYQGQQALTMLGGKSVGTWVW